MNNNNNNGDIIGERAWSTVLGLTGDLYVDKYVVNIKYIL